MIYKKPYAFMIKHFKLLHLILFIIIDYLLFSSNKITSIIIKAIKENVNFTLENFKINSFLINLSLVVVVILSFFIFLLLKHKNKPKKIYVYTITVTIFCFFLFMYLINEISFIETYLLDARMLRLLRDISRINFILLLSINIPIFVRCLGINIKKLNFENDLNELKIDAIDNEEKEANIKIDKDSLIRLYKKNIRESKYYYQENKFFINFIIVILSFLLIFCLINYYQKNRILNENEKLVTNDFEFYVNESYTSFRRKVSVDSRYLLILFSVKCNRSCNNNFSIDDFKLEGKSNNYFPVKSAYVLFSDIGKKYDNRRLKEDFEQYILIYDIKKEDRKEKFYLKYMKNGKKIKINPKYLEGSDT